MTLPSVFRPDIRHWQKLHDEAQTPDAKAIIGALLLVAQSLDQIYDAVASEDTPHPGD